MLSISDVRFFPIFGSKVNELVEDTFLIFVDIEDVRFIGTGQLMISLNHVTQKVTMSITIIIEGLFVVFIIKELKFQFVEKREHPIWGLFIRFGVLTIAAFICLGIIVIVHVNSRRQVWLELFTDVRCFVRFIIQVSW